MVIKLPKPTKADCIRFILDCWDPARAYNTDKWYPLFYNYEAEVLAQSVRKNSKTETVAKHVQEVINQKLKEESLEYLVDDENAKRVAAAILDSLK